MTKTVLFLCTGNYYRSRFAEELFNARAPGLGLCWRAESRGLALEPRNPGPISRHTRVALARLGVTLPAEPREPQPVTADDFARAQRVIAVKAAEHEPMIAARFPEFLAQVEFWQVHDLDCATPAEALPQLEQLVAHLLSRIADGPRPLAC